MHINLPRELMERCSRFVEARAGLHFPQERWMDLERALCVVASELGFESAEACVRWLISERASREQIEALMSRLTVGETYFFRDPKAFDALGTTVLPELIRTRRSMTKRLRIWSAGCCTGEEPYSIAIALSRALVDLASWDVTILGTDINSHFLRKAEAGIYSQWSFRGTSDEVRDCFFQRTADGRFQIIPRIRGLVTFGSVNLAEDGYPSLLNNTNAMDVIFCRNVLMYFSQEQARKATVNLHRSLVADGWLFPSGTEASRDLYGQSHNADIPGTIVYRKNAPFLTDGESRLPAGAGFAAAEVKRFDSGIPLFERGDSVRAAEPPVVLEANPSRTLAGLARELANEGHLDEALAACDRALLADKLCPSSHYLRGLIMEERGAHEEATEALRRALYLDHDFVVAHFALGNLMRRRLRMRDAGRCFENARTLLRTCDPATVLPESDGLTAGRLLEIIESNQECPV